MNKALIAVFITLMLILSACDATAPAPVPEAAPPDITEVPPESPPEPTITQPSEDSEEQPPEPETTPTATVIPVVTPTPTVSPEPAVTITPDPLPEKLEYNVRCIIRDASYPDYGFFQWFAAEAYERSDGRLNIEVERVSQSGYETGELVDALRCGDIEICEVDPAYVAGDIPVIEGLSIPGLFEYWIEMELAHRNWQAVLKKYEKDMGGYFLGSTVNEPKYVFSKIPLEMPDTDNFAASSQLSASQSQYLDLTFGFRRIHSTTEKFHSELERDVYTSCIATISEGSTAQLQEVCPYLTDIQLGTEFSVLIAGEKFWQELPDDLQTILTDLGAEFSERGLRMARNITESGTIDSDDYNVRFSGVKSAWRTDIYRAVTEKVIPNWIRRSGPEAEALFNEYLSPVAGITAHAGDFETPEISDINFSDVTATTITINWTTSEAATSRIEYWYDTNRLVFEDDDLVTKHSVTLSHLKANETYYFEIRSLDSNGNKGFELSSFNIDSMLP